MINLSELVDDTDFSAADFTVIRSAVSTDEHGRTQTAETTISGMWGVVFSSGDMSDIISDMETYRDNITLITKERLYAISSGYLPDRVVFNDQTYRVRRSQDFKRNGFYATYCELYDLSENN